MTEPAEVELTLEQAMERAIAHQREGDLDAAEELYVQILQHMPDHADAWHFRGLVAMARGQKEDALAFVEKALAVAPEYAEAHNNRGNLLLMLSRPQEAVAAWERALELKPDMAEAHFNMGRCYSASQQVKEALAAFRRTLELNPGQHEAYHRMAALLYSCGRIADAAGVYAEWLAVDPKSDYARHMLAACTQEGVPARASDGTVRGVFNGFAKDFDAQLAALQYQAPALVHEGLKRVLGTPAAALDVLDAGCGTGLCGPNLRTYARRLVGVDLAEEMVKRAHKRACYDELVVDELTAFLAAHPAGFDLVVSADTVCYFGELGPLMAATAAALRPRGHLVFTVERATEGAGYQLGPHGRYAHTEAYVRASLGAAGMTTVLIAAGFLRMEKNQPVAGLLIVARRQ
jgi:predicted TPR repeat methyltransferase